MKQVFILITLVVLASCANKVAPTGGDKDTLPPVMLTAVPENYSVNFSSRKITLNFNEYVQVQDIQKQVIFSPPIKPAPRIEVRKKSVLISLPDSLKSNTTYTISFGNAISDFAEANVLPGFRYVFSTGSFLDSMVVSGSLKDALTQKPSKGAMAMLYSSMVEDTLVGKTLPQYFARADDDGKFTIRNISAGSYRLIGLADNNNNYTAEIATEPIGSADKIIDLTDSVYAEVYLSKQPPARLVIVKGYREPPGKLVTIFSLPADSLKWNFTGPVPENLMTVYSAHSDTVILYGVPGIADSTGLVWTDNNRVLDTVVYIAAGKSDLMTAGAAKKLSGKSYPQQNGVLDPETNPSIQWAAPLKSFNFSRVTVTKDSAEFMTTGMFADTIHSVTVFEGSWTEGIYNFLIPSGLAIDVYGRFNDTIRFDYSIPPERTTGSIAFKFGSGNPEPVLLQLVNDKDEIVRQRIVNGYLKDIFERVSPGIYRLRIIADANRNNRWDPGDVSKNIQPERVKYYKEPITVRSNWEVELEWAE